MEEESIISLFHFKCNKWIFYISQIICSFKMKRGSICDDVLQYTMYVGMSCIWHLDFGITCHGVSLPPLAIPSGGVVRLEDHAQNGVLEMESMVFVNSGLLI